MEPMSAIRIELSAYEKPLILASDGNSLPLGSVYCVGRNYAKHIDEMGAQRGAEPVVFIKPPAAVWQEEVVPLPGFSKELHHEIEIYLYIGETASRLPAKDALGVVAGWGLALDLTARDLQTEAKKAGTPWAVSKGFDASCPLTPVMPWLEGGPKPAWRFGLRKNGIPVQEGRPGLMLWSFAELLAIVSRYFSLRPGDLLLTGTPEGVGPIAKGDLLELWGDGLETRRFSFE